MDYKVFKSKIGGNITVPPSKSHTIRSILFSSIAVGTSFIDDYLFSPDTEAMILACTEFGAIIKKENNRLIIEGNKGLFKKKVAVIDVGNSGQVLRFISALSALKSDFTYITGDYSICNIRPMKSLLTALNQLGVFAISTKNNWYAPVLIKGHVKNRKVYLDGKDSQPVSALLMLAALLEEETCITVTNPGEKPWIELTLYWLSKLGIKYENNNFLRYIVYGQKKLNCFSYKVPGDWSSAAFPIAAALVTESKITIHNVDFDDPQGDKKIIGIFERFGAKFIIDKVNKTIVVPEGQKLFGKTIDVNDIIDAIPILAVVACFAEGKTVITGGSIARYKESDRIASISKELQKMNAEILETEDGLIIKKSQLIGNVVSSHNDHRIAMSLVIAALNAKGCTVISNVDCIDKSFPYFISKFQSLGVDISEYESQKYSINRV